MVLQCQVAAQLQLDLDGSKMNTEPIANNEIIRWDNGDETVIDKNIESFIKNPVTPPETEAEEL